MTDGSSPAGPGRAPLPHTLGAHLSGQGVRSSLPVTEVAPYPLLP